MYKRRIAYLSALIFAVIFHTAYVAYASYLFLFTVLLFPLLAFITGIAPLFFVKVYQYPFASEYIINDSASSEILVKAPAVLPAACIKIRYRIKNITFNQTVEDTLVLEGSSNNSVFMIPLPTHALGRVTVEFLSVATYDYTGLFKRSLKVPDPRAVIVRALPKEPVPMPEMPKGETHTAVLRPKPGGGFAEDYDLRPYRMGDPLNAVHWKLSVKLDDLIIRESLISDKGDFIIAVNLFGSEREAEHTFSVLTWLNYYFNSLMISYKIAWYKGEVKAVNIENAEEFTDFVAACFAEPFPESGNPLPLNSFKAADWVYYISRRAENTEGGEGA